MQTSTGPLTLAGCKGQNVVLYFYPKDDTPGCTVQACNFRDSLPQFQSLNATIIGVSQDDLESHSKFTSKYSLNFTLASDTDGKTCQAYGVLVDKSMFGKSSQGIERTTFVIDSDGIIRGIWRRVTVEGHAEAVQKSVAALSTQQKAA